MMLSILYLLITSLPSPAKQHGLNRRNDLLPVNTDRCKSIEAIGPVNRLRIEDGRFFIDVSRDDLKHRLLVFYCLN